LRFFKLEREGKALNVKLATKVPEVEQPAPVGTAIAEALPLRAALKTLLDSHPKTLLRRSVGNLLHRAELGTETCLPLGKDRSHVQ